MQTRLCDSIKVTTTIHSKELQKLWVDARFDAIRKMYWDTYITWLPFSAISSSAPKIAVAFQCHAYGDIWMQKKRWVNVSKMKNEDCINLDTRKTSKNLKQSLSNDRRIQPEKEYVSKCPIPKATLSNCECDVEHLSRFSHLMFKRIYQYRTQWYANSS